MRRLTASLLLLFALAGTFVPLALAATADPSHACCIRKSHRCHASAAADPEQWTISASSCCTHDCCRAVTTSQWAHPQPQTTTAAAQNAEIRASESHPDAPAPGLPASQSTRAPPHTTIV